MVAQLKADQQVEKRERLTRRRRWDVQDEDVVYDARQLDRDVVNPDQIRTVIRAFRDKLPEIFPRRGEVPKTLVLPRPTATLTTSSKPCERNFGEGKAFCKKITYKVEEDPKSVLAQFRNDYYPRIAVTVDMIATGTDVKPLECLLFMRDMRSRNYFEQMKGRGTRTLDHDDLKKVTPSALSGKTHYVIVGRRWRHEIAQDRNPATRYQALRAAQGSRYGCDDGCTRRRHSEFPCGPPRPGSTGNWGAPSRKGSRIKPAASNSATSSAICWQLSTPIVFTRKCTRSNPCPMAPSPSAAACDRAPGTVGRRRRQRLQRRTDRDH